MARVDSWFAEWLGRHQQVHPREDWPRGDGAAEFFAAWMRNFILVGLSDRDVADEASDRLVLSPPRFLADHLPAVVKAAQAIYRERAEAGAGGDPNSRESAAAASKGCDSCGGMGLAVRWRQKSAGPGVEPTITLYCTCPFGRWIERTHREKSPEVRRRMHDLEDHPWLMAEVYRTPPLARTVPFRGVEADRIAKPLAGAPASAPPAGPSPVVTPFLDPRFPAQDAWLLALPAGLASRLARLPEARRDDILRRARVGRGEDATARLTLSAEPASRGPVAPAVAAEDAA